MNVENNKLVLVENFSKHIKSSGHIGLMFTNELTVTNCHILYTGCCTYKFITSLYTYGMLLSIVEEQELKVRTVR